MDVYFLSPKDWRLGGGCILQLQKHMYGLCDSGDHSNHTLSTHLEDYSGVQDTIWDQLMVLAMNMKSLR